MWSRPNISDASWCYSIPRIPQAHNQYEQIIGHRRHVFPSCGKLWSHQNLWGRACKLCSSVLRDWLSTTVWQEFFWLGRGSRNSSENLKKTLWTPFENQGGNSSDTKTSGSATKTCRLRRLQLWWITNVVWGETNDASMARIFFSIGHRGQRIWDLAMLKNVISCSGGGGFDGVHRGICNESCLFSESFCFGFWIAQWFVSESFCSWVSEALRWWSLVRKGSGFGELCDTAVAVEVFWS